jgi:hypothetical protein
MTKNIFLLISTICLAVVLGCGFILTRVHGQNVKNTHALDQLRKSFTQTTIKLNDYRPTSVSSGTIIAVDFLKEDGIRARATSTIPSIGHWYDILIQEATIIGFDLKSDMDRSLLTEFCKHAEKCTEVEVKVDGKVVKAMTWDEFVERLTK